MSSQRFIHSMSVAQVHNSPGQSINKAIRMATRAEPRAMAATMSLLPHHIDTATTATATTVRE